MLSVVGLYRYPIKSTAGESLAGVRAEGEGLRFDRRFMLARLDGTFVTARRHPRLQRVSTRFDGAVLSVIDDAQPGLRVDCARFEAAPFATGVWGDQFDARSTTMALDAWFSRLLDEPVRLLWVGELSSRRSRKTADRLSLADGYPLLLATTGSLADLNARSHTPHVMAQFRPNLVVDGADAFAEDRWQRIRIGDAVFRVAEPCARCQMINIDPALGERRVDGEPMRTLRSYRRRPGDKEVYFGQNLIVEQPGELRLGQAVEVLTSK